MKMDTEKIFNTSTKKYVELNSKHYKKLLNQGYSLINNQLVFIADQTINIELNEDIWREILLDSDINNLQNNCRLNKITFKICQRREFWVHYFNNHHIPLMFKVEPTTPLQWIKMFMALNYIINNYIKEGWITEKSYKKNKFNWNKWDEQIMDDINEDEFLDTLKYYYIINPDIVSSQDLLERFIEYNCGSSPILEWALQNGLNPNILFEDEKPLLYHMVVNINDNKYDDDLDHFNNDDWEEIDNDYKKRLTILLSYGADPNYVMNNGTIFHHVVEGDSIIYLDLFLKYGANPNIKNNKGETPLLLFCRLTNNKTINEQQKNKEKYFKIFSQYNADFNAVDHQGLSCEKMGYYKHIWG